LLSLLKNNRYFFIPLFIYLIAGAVILCCTGKGEISLLINRRHHEGLDALFMIITYIGDGLAAIIVILLVMLVVSRYYAMLLSITFLLCAIIIHFIKEYADTPRPRRFFENIKDIYYIKNLDIHSNYSFPSGHTAQAFGLFLIAAFMTGNKKIGFLFFVLAFLTGISRIYLMQHFFIDTYFGGLVGLIIAFFTYFLLEKYTRLKNLDSPLLKLS
jgi:membrane-associated phospholipid phosphatase